MEAIIDALEFHSGGFPLEAVKEAINCKEEITSLLLACLDSINADPTIGTENDSYMLHLYALYLLAQFREQRAF